MIAPRSKRSQFGGVSNWGDAMSSGRVGQMEQLRWTRQLNINYRTLTVCQHGVSNPFSVWTQTHVDQGFTWRPQSVSFATLESDSSSPRIGVAVQDSYSYSDSSRSLRIIRVPFQLTSQGIEVTSPLSESWQIELPPGNYSIYFAIEVDANGTKDEPWLYRLTFVGVSHSEPAQILRAGEDLNPPDELNMSAEPA